MAYWFYQNRKTKAKQTQSKHRNRITRIMVEMENRKTIGKSNKTKAGSSKRYCRQKLTILYPD